MTAKMHFDHQHVAEPILGHLTVPSKRIIFSIYITTFCNELRLQFFQTVCTSIYSCVLATKHASRIKTELYCTSLHAQIQVFSRLPSYKLKPLLINLQHKMMSTNNLALVSHHVHGIKRPSANITVNWAVPSWIPTNCFRFVRVLYTVST